MLFTAARISLIGGAHHTVADELIRKLRAGSADRHRAIGRGHRWSINRSIKPANAKSFGVPPLRRSMPETCRVTGESASQTKTSRNGGGYQKEMSVAKLLLLLAIICAFASFAFYTANDAVGDVPKLGKYCVHSGSVALP